jgi:hypothetical protein
MEKKIMEFAPCIKKWKEAWSWRKEMCALSQWKWKPTSDAVRDLNEMHARI